MGNNQPHSRNHALHYTSCLLLAGMRGLGAVKALVVRTFPVYVTGRVVKLLKCMNLQFWQFWGGEGSLEGTLYEFVLVLL